MNGKLVGSRPEVTGGPLPSASQEWIEGLDHFSPRLCAV
jgi:hypothetical protein